MEAVRDAPRAGLGLERELSVREAVDEALAAPPEVAYASRIFRRSSGSEIERAIRYDPAGLKRCGSRFTPAIRALPA
jgi:hypothetical protein